MKDPRRLLRSVHVPDEDGAAERAWEVVHAAFKEREPVAWPRRHARPLLAAAVVVAVVAGAISAPGRAVIRSLRDAIGREKVVGIRRAEPALFRLPAQGQALVASPAGPWVVQPDGSKRLLHGWDAAAWSPRALYLAVTRGHELAAVTPRGDVRWSLARRGLITGASWSFEGFRVAYLNGTQLRLVVGNGEGDHVLVPRVRPVAPAWRPVGPAHVLAYVGARRAVHVVDADTRRELGSFREGNPEELLWSADGALLAARSSGLISVYRPNGVRVTGISTRSFAVVPGSIPAAAFAPKGHTLAYVTYDAKTNRSTIYVGQRRLFTGPGHFTRLVWSPDGRWLLVAWPDANQLFFVRTSGPHKVLAVSDVRRQFGGFPNPAGWCCAAQ
jgi:WD40-like Beta Propeller Repeat